MAVKRKTRKLPDRTINIWNRYDFLMSVRGDKFDALGLIKHSIKCLKWSAQRITRGFSDSDTWSIYSYLQTVIPAMLKHLKDNRMGSPGYLGENYVNEEGLTINDSCHAEWDKILDRMIFLWRESDETTCSKKNKYEKEYSKAFSAFQKKYGPFGGRLRTKEEIENNKRKHCRTVHFMDEVPEYEMICEKYRAEEERLAKYRSDCKDEALDMLKEYFYDLWD